MINVHVCQLKLHASNYNYKCNEVIRTTDLPVICSYCLYIVGNIMLFYHTKLAILPDNINYHHVH